MYGSSDEARELALDFGVLLVAVDADTLVPLAAVLVAQCVRVEGQVFSRHLSDGIDVVRCGPNPDSTLSAPVQPVAVGMAGGEWLYLPGPCAPRDEGQCGDVFTGEVGRVGKLGRLVR